MSYETLNSGIKAEYPNFESDVQFLDKNEMESSKPIKYRVTNFTDLDSGSLENLTRGINYHNGYNFDPKYASVSNDLRKGLYEQKPCDGSGPAPLPTTGGFYRGSGNPDVESALIYSESSFNRKSCNPKENMHYTRTMSVFTEQIPSPYSDVNDFYQRNDMQYGINSRTAGETRKYNRSFGNEYKPY
jgi:hypothetical protein